jgi:hypothetical protein
LTGRTGWQPRLVLFRSPKVDYAAMYWWWILYALFTIGGIAAVLAFVRC